MIKILKNKAYLCGHFCTTRWAELTQWLAASEWKLWTIDATERATCKNFYYGDFVDFQYSDTIGKKDSDGIVRYRRTIGHTVDVQGVNVAVGDMVLYLSPFGIIQFSIEIDIEGVDHAAMVTTLQTLRNNCSYCTDTPREWLETVIKPLTNVVTVATGGCRDYNLLTEGGNKLKLFQIIEAEGLTEMEPEMRDTELYSLGCLTPPPTQPESGSYYERTMEAGRIAVFQDWSALALFDSFTMLSAPLPDFRRKIWADDYFNMIYIYSLYRQAFLYRYSALFRAPKCNIRQLEADILLFDRRYRYSRFSYNFLPLEIARAMERALELEEATNALHDMVTQASAVYDKESDSRMNTVLTGLTVITLCSTVWDLFSMIDAATGASIFRFATGLLVLLMVLTVLLLRKLKK